MSNRYITFTNNIDFNVLVETLSTSHGLDYFISDEVFDHDYVVSEEEPKNAQQLKITSRITYDANGIVFGNYWGGGQGWFESKPYSDYINLKKLYNNIKMDLESGALDGGMGYERLLGAELVITTQTVIKFNNQQIKYWNSFRKEFGDYKQMEND